MSYFNKKHLVLSIFLCLTTLIFLHVYLSKSNLNQSYSYNVLIENKIQENKRVEEKNLINEEWYIEIPQISLRADISEGVDENTLNEYVGHFPETDLIDGNVGLAAHNRGYKVNYFANIKELNIGDSIYYSYKGTKKHYRVVTKEIISETNWDFLEHTNENKLTLITCVENIPELRRCIQAIEEI